MAAEGTSRESLVYMGRIAEQSERYEEMVTLYALTPSPPVQLEMTRSYSATDKREDRLLTELLCLAQHEGRRQGRRTLERAWTRTFT